MGKYITQWSGENISILQHLLKLETQLQSLAKMAVLIQIQTHLKEWPPLQLRCLVFPQARQLWCRICCQREDTVATQMLSGCPQTCGPADKGSLMGWRWKWQNLRHWNTQRIPLRLNHCCLPRHRESYLSNMNYRLPFKWIQPAVLTVGCCFFSASVTRASIHNM